MKYIEIHHITKVLKKNKVLHNISLSLDKGKIYGFQEMKGSSKEMFFRAIAGLIKLDEGDIYIKGQKVQMDEAFPVTTGILIETPLFIEHFSAYKNLQLIASVKGVPSKKNIYTALKRVGLRLNDERKVKKYSANMKQKLKIAQAIVGSPELLLLDEPTKFLDEESVKKIINVLRAYKLEGKTILLSSEDANFLNAVSDQIIKIAEGHIVT